MIIKEWNNYNNKVMPPDAPDIQIKETRQAFMAGAFIAYNILIKAMDSNMDDKMLNQLFKTLYNELSKELK